jgi:5-methylcytosine-specific restriction protein B
MNQPQMLESKIKEQTEFQKQWPLARLEKLTLAEYTSPDEKECFSGQVKYGLENFGRPRGRGMWYDSIGISHGDMATLESYRSRERMVDIDAGYLWTPKLGESLNHAFAQLRSLILQIASNLKNGDISPILNDALELRFAWKIASLYQDLENPVILPVDQPFLLPRALCKLTNAAVLRSNRPSRKEIIAANAKLLDTFKDLNVFELVEKINFAFDTNDSDFSIDEADMPPENTTAKPRDNAPSNLILYGPPGTGKTYATAARAVQICDGQLPGGESFADIYARYEELRQAGRISFVTFHQAFGYEEFVEGIRPVTEGGQISYRVKPGVFKAACDRARVQHSIRPGLAGKPLKERTILKMSLGRSWSDEGRIVFDHCIQNECVLLGWGDDIDFSGCNSKPDIQHAIEAQRPQIEKKDSVLSFINLFKNEIKLGDLIVVTNGNSWVKAVAEVVGDYEFAEDAPFHQMRKVRWLGIFEPHRPSSDLYEKEVGMTSLYRLNPNHIRFEALEAWLNAAAKQPQDEPHVLIIDEINRANISKVFGELITLIEPDKREGQSQAITVKLPYSGEDFCVPGNLHIIGTMNTADRSIALLDTALRRRFDFEEVMPEPEVLASISIEGVDMVQMLTVINQRIEVLYDRDHTIGHAYFVKVGSLEDLDRTFRKKVIPLLQEYFHENWQKIRQVLGDTDEGDFIVRQVAPVLPLDEEDPFAPEAKAIYRLNPRPFSVQAFQRIYQGA